MSINKKSVVTLIVGVLILGMFLTIGTFAYWRWVSPDEQKKTVSFSSGDISDYIEYDEGESKFVGDFKVCDTYLDGVHTTISINKTEDATNLDLFATINMDINEIGDVMKTSSAVKWTLTEGNSTNPGAVLSSGNFLNASADETMPLYSNIEVTTTKKEYTIWLWVDINENPPTELTGEKLDTIVWTQVDQITNSMFEITRINANYQNINATVVNSMYNITEYQVTTSNVEPTSWQSISSSEQGKTYLLEYSVTSTGTYYVWFKDSNGSVVSASIDVTELDNSAPVCTWGGFGESGIIIGNTTTIDLTCVDEESDVQNINLTSSDVTLSNSSITISNIEKNRITNGYKYTFTVEGLTEGSSTLTLPANKILNRLDVGNSNLVSSSIRVNKIEVTFNSGNLISFKNTSSPVVSGRDNEYYAEYSISDDVITLEAYAIDYYSVSYTEEIRTNVKVYLEAYETYLFSALCNGDDYYSSSCCMISFVDEDGNYAYPSGGMIQAYQTGVYNLVISGEVGWEPSDSTVTTISELRIEKEVTYTEHANGDDIYRNDTLGSLLTMANSEFTKDNFTLDGWYTGKNGTGTKVTSTTSIPGNITYYAKWISNLQPVEVTFNANYLYDLDPIDTQYTDSYYYDIDENGTVNTYGTSDTLGYDYAYTNVKVYLEAGQQYSISGDCGGGRWVSECGLAFKKSDGTELYMYSNLEIYPESTGEYNVGFYYVGGMNISYSNMRIYKEETYTEYENGSTIYQEDEVGSLLETATNSFPGRGGYTLNWYTAESGGSRVTSSTVLTDDVTYYAHWIDTVAPSVSLVAQDATNLKLSATDNEGIVGYYFGTTNPGVGGVSYNYDDPIDSLKQMSVQPIANVEYTPVSSTKNWEITVTVTEAGTHYFSVIDAIGNVKTDTIDVFTITYNVNGGSGSTDNQLKLYGGTHTVSNVVPTKTGYTFLGWSTSSTATTGSYTSGDDFTINENKTLYAVYVDNIAPTASFAVSRSDTTISAVFSSVVEQGSGIKEYQYLVQTSSSCPSSGYSSSSSSSYSVTKSAGTYYICARIVDNMGNVSVIYSGSVVIPPSASAYTSAGAYTYTVPVTGNYQLEVWGAQGGGAGGYGGYSTGIVNLTAGTKLYVVVGGQGGKNAGGYNGGGSGQNLAGSATAAGYGGGGATHIAKASGLLQSVSSSNVYIVAGGGGGSGETTSKGAGHGGGYLGNSGTGSCYVATGGSQSSGGAPGDSDATSGGYGYGGNAPNGSTTGGTYGAGGGGGGYYGGGGNSFGSGSSCAGGGAGGSGYIGNSSLTYKSMYCYNCATSTSTSQITYSTTNVSSSATSYYAKSGDGAAKISYVIGSYSGPQLGVSGSLSSYYQYNAYYESKYGGMYISPHYVEQYYENGNYSIIKIDSIALTSSMYSQSVEWSVNYGITIDGKQYSCSGTAYTSNYTATNWPCTITSDPIYHNSDGSKTITIALTSAYTVSSQVGASWGTDTGTLSSKSVTLTKIPQ